VVIATVTRGSIGLSIRSSSNLRVMAYQPVAP
jgi:hypothetical protein